jgi:membrane protein YdbS with pleckstrin-like domain
MKFSKPNYKMFVFFNLMNNNDVTTQKQMSKRKVRTAALMLFAPAALCLIFCIKAYFTGNYLHDRVPLNLDEAAIVMKMIRCAIFLVMPALSVLLILSSRLIWRLSNKLDDEKGTK